MSLEEEGWIDGELESAPCTKSGLPVVWQVHIRTSKWGAMMWADFKKHESLRMDAALMKGDKKCSLECNNDTWSIDLKDMVQINDKFGTQRAIRRTVIVKQVLHEE